MKLYDPISISRKKFSAFRSAASRLAILFALSLCALLFGGAARAAAASKAGCSVWIDRSAPIGLVEKIPNGCERVYARDRASCSVEIEVLWKIIPAMIRLPSRQKSFTEEL